MLYLGRLLALLANIELGWKGLSGTNTLAYYENYGRKKFNNIGLRMEVTESDKTLKLIMRSKLWLQLNDNNSKH